MILQVTRLVQGALRQERRFQITSNNLANVDTPGFKPNRALLAEKSFIPFLEVLKHQVSKVDNTEKYLFELSDKHTIETVLIKHKERNTIMCIFSNWMSC